MNFSKSSILIQWRASTSVYKARGATLIGRNNAILILLIVVVVAIGIDGVVVVDTYLDISVASLLLKHRYLYDRHSNAYWAYSLQFLPLLLMSKRLYK